jgi:hypothetical protein
MIRRLVQKSAYPKKWQIFRIIWIEADLLAEISADGG